MNNPLRLSTFSEQRMPLLECLSELSLSVMYDLIYAGVQALALSEMLERSAGNVNKLGKWPYRSRLARRPHREPIELFLAHSNVSLSIAST